MNTSILEPELREFFGAEGTREREGTLAFRVGSRKRGFDIAFKAGESFLLAELRAVIPDDVLKAAQEKTESEGFSVEIAKFDGGVRLITSAPHPLSPRPLLVAVRNVLQTLMETRPKASWGLFGEMIVREDDVAVTVISWENPPGRLGWRTDIVATIPNEEGWFLATYGRDCVELPILSSVDHHVMIYVPFEDGSIRPVSVTETLGMLERVSHLLPERCESEVELLRKLHKISGAIRILAMGAAGALFGGPGIPSEEASEISKNLELLERGKGLDELLRMRFLVRRALLTAKKILEGEEARGVVVMNVRRVMRLGGGKAVYIGKEELSAIDLGDRVLVKVVEEGGVRKIVIEPLR